MAIDSKSLPQNILRCMTSEDRRPMGKAGETTAETQDRVAVKLEKELHEGFTNWLRIRSLPHIHCRMDRRSTIRKGWPDYTLLSSRLGCCVEFKAPGGKLSPEQVEVIAELESNGVPVLVTEQLADAITFARKTFNL